MKNTKILRTLLAATILAGSVNAAMAMTYMRGNDGDPETLDQHKTSTVTEARILRDMYIGLLTHGADGNPIPGMAESWEMSEDGLVYTFHLRQNAKWSNGDPVTAEDFLYSFNRIMNPATAAKYATILYPIKNSEKINSGGEAELGVRVIDTYTLEITLEQPTPYFLEQLTHQTAFPLHGASVEKYGTDFVKPENIVTNGAYVLESFTPNDKIILKKNPYFFDAENVAIDIVHIIPFEDRANCARRFEAGEVHSCSDVAGEQLQDLKKRLGDQVRVLPYLGTYYYAFNTANEKLADVRVRQALSMVINRDFLADEIWQGSMFPAYSLVPPGISNYVEDVPTLSYANESMLDREDAALALMEEAGYGPNNPLKIEISYNIGENHKNAATAIADMWASIGVETTFNVRDGSAHYAMLRDNKEHEVARAGWIADYGDPQNFLFLNQSNNMGFNYGNYENPEYDALMIKAAETIDIKERAEILAQAEEMFLEDLPQLPLLYYGSCALVSPKLEGWVDNLRDHHPTRFMRIVE